MIQTSKHVNVGWKPTFDCKKIQASEVNFCKELLSYSDIATLIGVFFYDYIHFFSYIGDKNLTPVISFDF